MESLFAVFLGGKDTFALVQLKHYGFAINRCGCRICQRHWGQNSEGLLAGLQSGRLTACMVIPLPADTHWIKSVHFQAGRTSRLGQQRGITCSGGWSWSSTPSASSSYSPTSSSPLSTTSSPPPPARYTSKWKTAPTIPSTTCCSMPREATGKSSPRFSILHEAERFATETRMNNSLVAMQRGSRRQRRNAEFSQCWNEKISNLAVLVSLSSLFFSFCVSQCELQLHRQKLVSQFYYRQTVS